MVDLFKPKPLRFHKGFGNGFLFVAMCLNAWLVTRLMFGARGDAFDPDKVWLSRTFEVLSVGGIVAALALGCYAVLARAESHEIKWGGRIIATGLPLAGVAIAFWAHFSP